MKTLFATTAAFAALMIVAPIGNAHAADLNVCVNDAGRALLRQAIQTAQYDVTSRENVTMHVLQFSADEYRVRTDYQQDDDVIVRAARRLNNLNDSVTLTMARALGLDRFFYDDSLICLHNAHIGAAPVSHGGEVKVIVQPAARPFSSVAATGHQGADAVPYAEQVRISDRLRQSHRHAP